MDTSAFYPAIYNGEPPIPGRCWHYTTSHLARKIVASGKLQPFPQFPGATPLVWASLDHIWERTVCKPVPGGLLTWEYEGVTLPQCWTFEGMQGFGTKLVRFALAVEDVPLAWDAACRAGGIRRSVKTRLDRAGRGLGSTPTHWRASLHAIPKEAWLEIALWQTDRWVPVA
jgi:hypothetical protein